MHAYGVCPLPPAPQSRWAALPCLQFGNVVISSSCAQGFPHTQGMWYHCPGVHCGLLKRWTTACQTAYLPFSEVRWASLPARCLLPSNMQVFLSANSVANAFALWYDKFSKLLIFVYTNYGGWRKYIASL